ncbi:cytochrome P450 [Phlebopus sp. FC_14]|nr:cytochrome P450 [Phlebopus sp. FC_14]
MAGLVLLAPLFLVATYATLRLVRRRTQRQGLPLPPGPSSLPLFGNALSIDLDEPWKTYTNWAAIYGDLMYLQILDQDIIVINSQADAVQLFEKSSAIYSDRPFFAFRVPFGMECNFGLAPYGDHWRLCRRIFHQTFRPEAALNLRSSQLRRARQMVLNMIEDPAEYPFHYATFAVSLSISAVYGYEPRPREDPLVQSVEHFNKASIPASSVATQLVLKLFPFVLRLPDWFPVLSVKQQSVWARKCAEDMVETPHQYVQKQMEDSNGMPVKSMVSDHLTRMQKYDETYRAKYESALKAASAGAHIGSLETTSSSLMVFTLAMVMNPDVLKHAQTEIDAVVGTERLPEFQDRINLPYVEAVLRETVRWQPILPLGVPHATTKSDVYKGFHIPKGATVFGNAWAMSRDESRYPNASQFNPGRFFNADGTLNDDEPQSFAFGFGRRICPGRYVGDASLWSSIATMLATLDFAWAKDAQGRDVVFEPTYENSLVQHSRPADFPCSISPRLHIDKIALEAMIARMDLT